MAANQNEWLSWAEDKADLVINILFWTYVFNLTASILKWFQTFLHLLTGFTKRQACVAHCGSSLFSFHIFWGWYPNVDPMEWTTRVYGYFMGLWLFLGHTFRYHQSSWPVRWSHHGDGTLQSRLGMFWPFWYCCPSNHCLQYFVGLAVLVPQLGLSWRSLTGLGWIPIRRKIVVSGCPFSR